MNAKRSTKAKPEENTKTILLERYLKEIKETGSVISFSAWKEKKLLGALDITASSKGFTFSQRLVGYLIENAMLSKLVKFKTEDATTNEKKQRVSAFISELKEVVRSLDLQDCLKGQISNFLDDCVARLEEKKATARKAPKKAAAAKSKKVSVMQPNATIRFEIKSASTAKNPARVYATAGVYGNVYKNIFTGVKVLPSQWNREVGEAIVDGCNAIDRENNRWANEHLARIRNVFNGLVSEVAGNPNMLKEFEGLFCSRMNAIDEKPKVSFTDELLSLHNSCGYISNALRKKRTVAIGVLGRVLRDIKLPNAPETFKSVEKWEMVKRGLLVANKEDGTQYADTTREQFIGFLQNAFKLYNKAKKSNIVPATITDNVQTTRVLDGTTTTPLF